jgi:NADPH:quinone reductase-like Zn-dependent oxidoreductase
LSLKPSSMSFEQAAATPQAGLLALQALCDKGQIHSGQSVLINGAGGGVGSFAIQLAKSFGAEVTGVDSTSKLDSMRLLGADQVIDYTREDFTRNGLHYDLIVDAAAYHSITDYKRALSFTGTFVMVGGSSALANRMLLLGPWFSIFGSKKISLLMHQANKGLDSMIELFEAGKYVPVIDRRYPLADVADALRYFGEGQTKGKIVITF